MQKAQAFYSGAFGWKFNDYGPEYAGIQREHGEAGGRRFEFEDPSGNGLAVWSEK